MWLLADRRRRGPPVDQAADRRLGADLVTARRQDRLHRRGLPRATPEQTAAKDKEKEGSKKKVRIYDRLMIRHWNVWDEGKRSHLFVADAHSGEARDLTPKLEVNTPPAPFGGSSDYAWSPDGKELAFTAEPSTDAAWSTNTDIWTVPVEGGDAKNLTEANKGADAQPAYSPDGRWLAYVSQARAGFEVGPVGADATRPPDRPDSPSRPKPSIGRCSLSPGTHRCRARSSRRSIMTERWPIIGFQINDDGTSQIDSKRLQFALTRGGAAPAFSVSPKGGSLVFVRSRVGATG